MDNTASILTSQVAAAAACSYILNLLQRWRQVPWVTTHTAGINMTIRALLAGAATIGISWQWNSADHSLLITGLGLTTIIHGMWHWFSQYAFTHLAGATLDSAQAKQTPIPVNGDPDKKP